MFLAYWCGNASWYVSIDNSSNPLENRLPKIRWQSKASSWYLQTVLVGPGLPHVQSCRINPALVSSLLALSPCPWVTPSIKLPHIQRGWWVCTCPQATADQSKRGTVSAGVSSGRVKATFPAVIPSPCSTPHVGTEGLWGSALTAAICRTLFSCLLPIPCSTELSCCLTGMFLMSNIGPRDLLETASCPFSVCPLRTAVADASWCFLAFMGVSKKENWRPDVVCSLCAQWLWLQPLILPNPGQVPSKLSRNWIISYFQKPRWSFCDGRTEEINPRESKPWD